MEIGEVVSISEIEVSVGVLLSITLEITLL